MISSGLRGTFRYLVEHKHVSTIVTTAGGIEEGFINASTSSLQVYVEAIACFPIIVAATFAKPSE